MRGKDVESKRTAQAALTLLVEYCGAHSQDSSVRRELPLVDKWWYVQTSRGCFPSWSPRVWGLSLETTKGFPMAAMSWRCSNVVHSWIVGGYLFIR